VRTTFALLAVVAVAAAAAACGSGAAGGGEATAGGAAPEAGTARPPSEKPRAAVPPPTRSGSPGKSRMMRPGPPPALIETPGGSVWLAFGSYCWSGPEEKGTVVGLCVDMVPAPADLPVVRFVPGQRIRIRLAFEPREVSLTVGGSPILMQPRRVLEWTATRGGVLELFVYPERGGDATYRARLVRTGPVAS
jgi:hypothetical protein